ncbi:hypothetical protein INR49_025286 [Caranx melampygus]|nr:hypothetical protein INR49_025286 [Caranx melampygus]
MRPGVYTYMLCITSSPVCLHVSASHHAPSDQLKTARAGCFMKAAKTGEGSHRSQSTDTVLDPEKRADFPVSCLPVPSLQEIFCLFVGTHGVWIHGLDWRILPAASEIITHLIRPDLAIKAKSAVLPHNLKAASVQPSAADKTDRSSTSAAQSSCKGRCGAEYYRGYMCQCDYTCLSYGECCKDYESQCTTKPPLSEANEQAFSEGNDADIKGQVLPNDEFSDIGLEDPGTTSVPESTSGYGSTSSDLLDPQVSSKPTLDPDTLEFSNDTVTAFPPTEATPSDNEPTQADDGLTTTHMSSGEPATEGTDVTDPASSTYEGTTLPEPTAAEDSVSTDPTSAASTELPPTASIPELGALGQDDVSPDAQTTETPEASSDEPEVSVQTQDDTDVTPVPDATTVNPSPDADVNNPEDTTTDLPSIQTSTSDPSGGEPDALTTDIPSTTVAAQEEATTQATSDKPKEVTQGLSKPKPQKKPEQPKPSPPKPTPTKPISKPEAKPLLDDTSGYQADDNNDTNLCSGRPISGLTTLRNGTIVVFRGHYFWVLDRNRMPGPAQGITQVWGVPSPIDTVFTRCNCQGKTYIFKGPKYWRFENDALDPGYPKVIETGFEGLRGHITAALSVPQHQRRTESVYFFKRGGLVQKYSYQSGTSPTCGRKPQVTVYTVRHRMVRQAVSALGPTINIRTSWRGFPSTITAAVSVPNNREPDGYKYYVFSRSKSHNVRLDGARPVLAAPKANASPQSNDVFKCPKKV